VEDAAGDEGEDADASMQLAKKEMDRGPLVSGRMGWSRGGDGWRKLLDFFILWLAK